MSNRPVYYLPINDPDVLLEGCKTLFRTLIQRIIQQYINSHSNYMDDANVTKVKVLRLEIEFTA